MKTRTTIRPVTPDDAVAVAGIRAAALPHFVLTAAGARHRLLGAGVAAGWLAVTDGEAVGFALCNPPYERGTRVSVVVAPGHLRAGVGSALLAAAEAFVVSQGEQPVNAVADGDAGLAFAQQHGYDIGRQHRFSVADVAAAPEPPAPGPGIRLHTFSGLDPVDVWRLHTSLTLDDPSGMGVEQPYETWHAEDWAFPDHAADLGVAAAVGDELVAVTHVFAGRQRGARGSAMSGVRADQRGRGLARLVKGTSVRLARDAGFTHAFTANDAGNAPMLAVNDWLGYRPVANAWSVSKPFG